VGEKGREIAGEFLDVVTSPPPGGGGRIYDRGRLRDVPAKRIPERDRGRQGARPEMGNTLCLRVVKFSSR